MNQKYVITPESRSVALRLLARRTEIQSAIADGKWSELTALRDFMSEGLAVAPGKPSPTELSRRLKERAQLYNSGLYTRVLDALADRNDDAKAGAMRRGLDARAKMAVAEGGAISAPRAAKLLQTSPGAVLNRARFYRLLARRDWRQEELTYLFPVWQFHGNRVLLGICKILGAFQSWHRWFWQRDDWGVMFFPGVSFVPWRQAPFGPTASWGDRPRAGNSARG